MRGSLAERAMISIPGLKPGTRHLVAIHDARNPWVAHPPDHFPHDPR